MDFNKSSHMRSHRRPVKFPLIGKGEIYKGRKGILRELRLHCWRADTHQRWLLILKRCRDDRDAPLLRTKHTHWQPFISSSSLSWDSKRAVFVILPAPLHYHMNVITQQLHTGLSNVVSSVFDLWGTISTIWHVKCENSKQPNALVV